MAEKELIPHIVNGTNSPFVNTGFESYLISHGKLAEIINAVNNQSVFTNSGSLFERPSDYISSITLFPFDLRNLSILTEPTHTETSIYLGNWDTGIDGIKNTGEYQKILELGSYTFDGGESFKDFSPYTSITLYVPFCGFTTLDTSLVMGKTIKLLGVINLSTGAIDVYITIETDTPYTIQVVHGNCGVSIPWTDKTTLSDIQKNLLKVSVNTIPNAIPSGSRGVTNGINALASLATAIPEAMAVKVSKGTLSSDSWSNFFAPQNAFLIIEKQRLYYPDGFEQLRGKPCGKAFTLGSIHGFTVVEDIHIEGISNATDGELEAILAQLKEGVIL